MDESLRRLGYTRKRSHAQTEEGEGSASLPDHSHSHSQSAYRDSHAHLQPISFDADQAQNHNHTNSLHFLCPREHLDYPPRNRLDYPASAADGVHSNTSVLHHPGVENMASEAPRRFVGDGYDFRRPVGPAGRVLTTDVFDSSDEADEAGDDDNVHMSLRGNGDVIDLTADDSGYGASQGGNSTQRQQGSNEEARARQAPRPNGGSRRLPRGMDIIIDLDNGEEEWRMATPPPAEPGSPEIQFISSRPIDPPNRGHPGLGGRNPEGNEVEFVRSNTLPAEEVQRRRHQEVDRALGLIGDLNGRFVHLRAQVERFNARVNHTTVSFRRAPIAPPRGPPRARGHVHVGFAAPGLLDFDMVAFDLGHEPAGPPPVPPTYQAPAKAPEGFTRSPDEEEPLICPNCEEELCVGDDEVKKQVWIVKACGHVYCGECTKHRSVKNSSKGKERPPKTKPFKECVVKDCGKKVARTGAMFQIFL